MLVSAAAGGVGQIAAQIGLTDITCIPLSALRGDNMRLEVVVSPEVADAILERLAQEYFPNYALVAWVADVQVVRGEKYR